MDRIPFTLPEDGLRENTGYVYFDGEFVVIDVRSKMLGLFDEKRDGIKVALTALEDVWLERRIIRDKLVLRPRTFDLLEAVPGDHDREVALRTKRKDRARVEDLIDEIQHAFASSGEAG